ncbi:unnamed protein product [Brachionus calyciflorus]|uniref:Carboxylesterase type B domain-containing protein n=1 Tax=Brachionus calyciflorus TaxID=104777 RepID=A0A813XC97_9BILA|nr:unnamed protein product [Brachionus calyciflorus]
MNLFLIFVVVNAILIDGIYLYNLTSGVYLPKKVEIMNKVIDQLLGVPYADIPLPFQKSTKYSKYSNLTRIADKWGPFCYQPIIFQNSFYGNLKIPHGYDMSLNCLVINLYIPKELDTIKKPAMFYIHGGSNAAGGSSFADGSALAALGDVIVAIPNYRLDVLGFLNKQNLNEKSSNLSGNYGLWDQVNALKWLHENCDELGCDKNSITVFGHSAGSADSLILALSKHAQPYIKRIIMQSGSALSEWAYLYDKHILEKLTESKNDPRPILKSLNFKNSKYINSLNDSLINFVSITTCSLTHKSVCFKQKIHNLTLMINSGKFNENKYLNYIHNIIKELDFNELMSLVGYFQKFFIDNFDLKFFENFYSKNDFNINDFKNATSVLYENFMSRKNYYNNSESFYKLSLTKGPCFSDLALIVTNQKSLYTICEFFQNYTKLDYEKFYSNQIIKYFLNCFKEYFKWDKSNGDVLHEMLLINENKALVELENCLLHGVNQTNLNEIRFLTESSRHLTKPTTDGDLILDTPLRELYKNEFYNSNIDVMVGITRTESFFFLLHEYKLIDMINEAFVYSSLLNKTENLLDKLSNIHKDENLSLCLKKNLLNFYGVNMSEEEVNRGLLKKRVDALELMSDYDFRLAMVTQLKFYLEKNATNKIYAYFYTHQSSFNYLLDHMKSFHKDYEVALKQLNYSVTPHFSELDFVFGLPVLSKENLIRANKSVLAYNYTDEEYQFSFDLIEYWSNFAKYGNPNSNKQKEWKNFNGETFNIFELNGKRNKANEKLYSEWLKRHEFWYETFPNNIYDKCVAKRDNSRDVTSWSLFPNNSNKTLIINSSIFINIFFILAYLFNY